MLVSKHFKTHSLFGKHKHFTLYWNILNELNIIAKKEIEAVVSLEHAFLDYTGCTQVKSSPMADNPDPHVLGWQWGENMNWLAFADTS